MKNNEKAPVAYSKELNDFLTACSSMFKDEQRPVKRKTEETPPQVFFKRPCRKRVRNDVEEKNASSPDQMNKIALASCLETFELSEEHLAFFDEHRDLFYWEDEDKAKIHCSEISCRFKTKQGNKCLVDHMISAHGYRDILCDQPDCSYIAFSQKNMSFHKVNFHQRKQKVGFTHPCPYDTCKYSFRLISEFRNHLNVHKNIVFSCNYCQYRSSQRKLLHDHLSHHFNISNFLCEICSRPFSEKCRLKTHMRTVHGKWNW